MNVVLVAQQRNAALEGVAAGRSNDVPNEQQVERIYLRDDAFAFRCAFKK